MMQRTLPATSVIAALVVMVPEVLIEVVPAMAPLVMAAPDTLPAVEIVASFVSTIAALALMSPSTIVPSAILLLVTTPLSMVHVVPVPDTVMSPLSPSGIAGGRGAAAQLMVPEPLVLKNWPLLPSADGRV